MNFNNQPIPNPFNPVHTSVLPPSILQPQGYARPVEAVGKQTPQTKLAIIDKRWQQNISEFDRNKLSILRNAVVKQMQDAGMTAPPLPDIKEVSNTAMKGVQLSTGSQMKKSVEPTKRLASAVISMNTPPTLNGSKQPNKQPAPTPLDQQPFVQPRSVAPQTTVEDSLMPSSAIQSLLTRLSPSSLLEQDVQLLLQEQLASFVESNIQSSLLLAKHRTSTQSSIPINTSATKTPDPASQSNLAVKDVRLAVEMGYGITLAGYGEVEQGGRLGGVAKRASRAYKNSVSVVESTKSTKRKK